MSRYSYSVEKLLRESKSPSITILLEEEEDSKEAEESSSDEDSKEEKASSDEEGATSEEEMSDDPFGEKEPSEEEGEGDEAPKGEESGEKGIAELEGEIKRLGAYFKGSDDAGKKIDDTSHEYEGLGRRLMSDLNKLSSQEMSIRKNFESYSYKSNSIENFLFEDKSQESIEAEVEELESKLNSKENTLPDPLEIAKTSYRYFERFDDKDKAIYIIKLVSKFFKRFVNPEKDKIFDEFLEYYIDILRDNGIDLELDGLQQTNFRTAVGARQTS